MWATSHGHFQPAVLLGGGEGTLQKLEDQEEVSLLIPGSTTVLLRVSTYRVSVLDTETHGDDCPALEETPASHWALPGPM